MKDFSVVIVLLRYAQVKMEQDPEPQYQEFRHLETMDFVMFEQNLVAILLY